MPRPVKQVFALRLKDGCCERYRHAHDHVWPELAERFRELSIDTSIHWFEPYLFVFSTAPSARNWDELGISDVTRRWNEYMSELLETNPDGSIKRYDMPELFAFGVFKSD